MPASLKHSNVLSTLQASLWWAVERSVHQVSRHLRAWQADRATALARAEARAELAALSDRELRDLGITRDQISTLVDIGRSRQR